MYKNHYASPIGTIRLEADDAGLTGLWFAEAVSHEEECNLPVFNDTKRWLAIYFSGKEPDFRVPFHYHGTDFQNTVWDILCTIPYGKVVTYGDIAKQIAAQRGIRRMSAQAVGGAVGSNPISIIVPCHRVIGANGNLVGYGGGLDKKIALLKTEGAYRDSFYATHLTEVIKDYKMLSKL